MKHDRKVSGDIRVWWDFIWTNGELTHVGIEVIHPHFSDIVMIEKYLISDIEDENGSVSTFIDIRLDYVKRQIEAGQYKIKAIEID